jgi:hypothetical protein
VGAVAKIQEINNVFVLGGMGSWWGAIYIGPGVIKIKDFGG